MQTLARLASNWQWILIGIVLLIILLLIVVYWLLRKASKRSTVPTDPAAAGQPQTNSAMVKSRGNPYLQLRVSFIRSLGLLKGRITGREYRYKLPWFLMLGKTDSGKTTVLTNTGLNLTFSDETEEAVDRHNGLNWRFYDNAVVLDVAGELGGRTDDLANKDGGWNSLLRLLLKYRPKHAIDGLILAIPADELIGPASLKTERLAQIKASAFAFYQRLWRAQKVLGLSFPVYILITKCDQIAGFSSFCRALPKNLQDNIFGWSNPYTLENSFTSTWIYEAFDEIEQQLVQLQLEIFAGKENVEDKDELFFFPTKLQEIESPLQAYLEILFKQSGYHQPFFLRGIYFCGDNLESSVQMLSTSEELPNRLSDGTLVEPEPFPYFAPVPGGIQSAPIRPAFIKDLFEHRIFQERGLARPVFTTLFSRDRVALTAQILALLIIVIGGLGLTFSYRNLSERGQRLQTLLNKIPHQLTVADEAHKGLGSEINSPTARLGMDSRSGRSVSKSGVELGEIDLNASRENEREFMDGIARTDGSSFSSVFIPSSWFSDIDDRMVSALVPAFKVILLDSSKIELDNRIAELVNNPNIRINYFLVKLNELVTYTRLYGRLTNIDSGSLDDLDLMVKAIHFDALPHAITRTNSLYSSALFKAKGSQLNNSAMGQGADRFETLLTRLYEDNVRESSKEISNDFLEEVIRTDELISSKDYTWLANYHFVAHQDFGNKTYQAAVHDLRVAFTDLARERFMQHNALDVNFRARLQGRDHLTWDKESLEKAITLYGSYESYIANLQNSYDPVQRKANAIALNQLQSNMIVLIRQAQQHSRSSGLAIGGALQREALANQLLVEVRNLKEVEEPLGNLMDICNQIGIGKELTGPVSDQTFSILEGAYGLMLLDRPYAVKRGDFSWWDGARPVSLSAFNVSTAEELARYLSATREDISQLATDYATPVITFSTAKHLERLDRTDYKKKWLEIIDDLNAYKNKQPENAVSSLESFIMVDLDKTSMSDCLRSVPRIDPGDLSDSIFRSSRLVLRQKFFVQCEQLARADVFRQYNDIADFFNKHLTGKFPFAAIDRSQSLDEADPQTILEFYQMFDTMNQATKQALTDSTLFGTSRLRALVFIDQVEKARSFLLPFIGKSTVPLADLDVKFRVNERQEQWASQIIDWQLDIGKESLDYRDGPHLIRWRFGDPIRLSLRWAKDSPTIPDSVSRPPDIDGRVAYFEYSNSWSLLSLLVEHGTTSADFYDPIQADPATLKFDIPIKAAVPSAQNAQQPLGRDHARVFVRLNVLPIDKKEPLAVPVFPRRAPVLVRSLTERGSGD